MRIARTALKLLAFGIASICADPARCAAQDAEPARDQQAVEVELFAEATQLIQEGGCAEFPVTNPSACHEARARLKRVVALNDSLLGAWRNLALVERNLGLVASALVAYEVIAARAPTDANPARRPWAQFALESIAELKPRVPYLIVELAPELRAGTHVEVDGTDLRAEYIGARAPLDPGAHVIVARRPGHKPFERRVELAEAQTLTVSVELEAAESAAAAAPVVAPSAPLLVDRPVQSRRSPAAQYGPWVLGGAGLIATGVGLGFGWRAIDTRKSACGSSDRCEPDGLEDARTYARTANIVTAAGAALVAGSLVWLVLRPSENSHSEVATSVRPRDNGLELFVSGAL